MSPQGDAVLLSALVATLVGTAGAVVVLGLARRRAAVAATAAPLVVVAALAAGVYASGRAMYLAEDDSRTMLLVLLATVPVAVGVGLVVASRVHSISAAAERESADRRREAELEAGRRELVAWVSHDLRTPLAGIRAIAEALEDGVGGDPGRLHGQLRSEVMRMDDMVEDLLALSRLQSPAMRLDRTTVSLTDLVSDALASAEPRAAAAGVRLVGHAGEAVTAHVDAREVTRAVDNLVGNALRHTPPGEAVEVTVAAEGEHAVVEVRDACGGIPEDALPRLFEAGFRGSTARTPGRGGGAGLGLAIVRGVADVHGGDVGVENVPGGCRFRLRLPLVGPALAEAGPRA